jgi:hypothetical protein
VGAKPRLHNTEKNAKAQDVNVPTEAALHSIGLRTNLRISFPTVKRQTGGNKKSQSRID